MMNIVFSRHARRRLNLYKIDSIDLLSKLNKILINYRPGKYEILLHELKNKYKYPVKIVFEVKVNKIIIITVYPLKKGRKS